MPLRATVTLAATAVAVVLLISFRTPPAAPAIAVPPSPTPSAAPSPAATATPSASPPSGGGSPTPTPTPASTPKPTPAPTGAGLKDGTFPGQTYSALYGNIQVQLVVTGARIIKITALQYPNDNPQSSYINSQALPLLRQEVLRAQSAKIDGIGGATYTSYAYYESLQSALKQARA
ncbi:MAG TPA: FMN-binding protein [Candidatus Micrarchaeia archaeon]|nr:FMN-binding protein [Candidatus Micrarchaeia archaeon]